jgi:hypothetical protein
MNLAVNELFKDEQTGQLYRVLWIDSEQTVCYLIDVKDEKAFPVVRKVREVIQEIIQDELTKVLIDPYLPIVSQEVIEKHKQKRDQAWKAIHDMVMCEPDIYRSEKRGILVQRVIEKTGITKPTLYKYLRRFWQRGKTPNALLPDYDKSGGKGKEKSTSEKKRGRPSTRGVEGINVDEETKRIFRIAIEKYYLNPKKNSLASVYRMMIREFYAENYYMENGKKKIVIADENMLPTLRQFRYWYQKEYDISETTLARQGRKKYEKDYREVLGSSTLETFGPGSRFQIDATVADVYLVSSYNPNWIIGRPVMYVVVDVFSRMIVGMYIGLEGPSWMGAMMALANMASDKVEFCKQYGIQISKDMWPCEHLPEVLLADRGELEGYNVERLIAAFNLHVENAPPYRADWKGIVEKKFDTLQQKVKPFLPGYVEKDFQERGVRDYRLDAKLTLEQFTQIMIKQIILYNTKHYIGGYIRNEKMVEEDVQPIPIELWKWGVKNQSGKLRYIPEPLVQLHLLPQDSATVTYKGIRFKGMMYSCERALKESWFSIARQKGSWKTTVSYDPRNVSTIYLWDEQKGMSEYCYLLEHQERYKDKSLEDVNYLLAYERQMKKEAEYGQLGAEVSFIADVEGIVEQAKKEVKMKQAKQVSKSARTKAIRENRKIEREQKRSKEAFSLSEKQEKAAEVISLPSVEQENFNRPSIKDILRKRKERLRDD